MNLKDLSHNRYSVRDFLPKEIESEKLDYILECVRLAPSACNFQPWFLYIATSDEAKTNIRKAYDREWFRTAPMYIVVCGDHSQSWKRSKTDNKDHCDVDAAIVSERICLATHEIGLGTCWVCNFDPEVLKKLLNIPDHLEAVAIFPIGHIDQEKSKVPEKKRKSISEITKRI